jgi:hypothetical protein
MWLVIWINVYGISNYRILWASGLITREAVALAAI